MEANENMGAMGMEPPMEGSSQEAPQSTASQERPGGAAAAGYYQPAPRSPLRKSVLLTGVLSLFPGLGHVYIGLYKLAFIHIGVFATLIGIINSGGPDSDPGPFFGTAMGFFYLYNIIDAVRRATIYNHILDGVVQAELPEDFKLPMGGSIGLGVILIAAGLLFFLNTMFGMSLAWLAEWWPLALVAGGVYLVVKSDTYKSWRDGAI